MIPQLTTPPREQLIDPKTGYPTLVFAQWIENTTRVLNQVIDYVNSNP